ncbi:MAG: nucleotidyltransferase family protein [Waterburya sp.]
MNQPQVGLILLAAGESKRMGTPKQLLFYRGASLIRHAITEAIASNCHRIIVVIGAYSDRIKSEIENLPIYICHNPHWQQGMSASISLGIKTLTTIETQLDGVIIALGDQPLITAYVYNRLIENYLKSRQKAIASNYANTLGVPALFDRTLFPDLLSLSNQGGAKQLLNQYSDRAFDLNIPQAAIDIDTPDDYQKLLSL